jgi:flagellar hook-associated protein 1 FlgK
MSHMVGLNTALTGIHAAQAGLNTVSHNIANAHTTGYTRQRVNQTTRLPWESPIGAIGTGTAASVGRTRDAFLDARARATLASSGYTGRFSELLARTEGVLNEPDAGISTELGALWNSFEDLAATPDNVAARLQVQAALSATVGRIRTISQQWDRLSSDTATDLAVSVTEANDMLAELAELNRVIPRSGFKEGASQPSDLLDQRDILIDRLSASLGTTASYEADGTVTLRLGGTAVVEGVTAKTLTSDANSDVYADGVAVDVGGEAAAMQDFVQTELPARRAALDAVVVTLADGLNFQHSQGYRRDGAAGGALLSYGGPSASATLTVAIGAPGDIAAAQFASAAAHDGGNAQALAALRSTPPSGGTQTVDDALRAMVIGLATGVASAKRIADSQDSLNVGAGIARQSAHGVSLDEEMVDLVKYQRALEAASRVMTAIDEALNKLVNNTGLVGR